MIALAALKQDLRFIQDLGEILDAFKIAALIQFRLFQAKEKTHSVFLREIEATFKLLAAKLGPEFWLFEGKKPGTPDKERLPQAIVAITSDEGFLGELNTLTINACLDKRRSKDDEIIVVGEQGVKYLEDMDEEFEFFPAIPEDAGYKQMERLRQYLLEGYGTRFSRVFIVYPEFLSLTTQRTGIHILLPYEHTGEITDKESLVSYGPRQEESYAAEILMEPSLDSAVETLMELWMGFKFLEISLSSKLAEYAARIMHLEGSFQEISSLKQKLSFIYFRQVHSLSDKTIREISAAKILLRKNNKVLEAWPPTS